MSGQLNVVYFQKILTDTAESTSAIKKITKNRVAYKILFFYFDKLYFTLYRLYDCFRVGFSLSAHGLIIKYVMRLRTPLTYF